MVNRMQITKNEINKTANCKLCFERIVPLQERVTVAFSKVAHDRIHFHPSCWYDFKKAILSFNGFKEGKE